MCENVGDCCLRQSIPPYLKAETLVEFLKRSSVPCYGVVSATIRTYPSIVFCYEHCMTTVVSLAALGET